MDQDLHIRIATRASDLALWQSRHVEALLHRHGDRITTELVPITTAGDRIIDQPLRKVGGKGLFIKELEVALLSGAADIAVHSMKDLPAELAEDFIIAAMLERQDPRDALVSGAGQTLDELAPAARVGTSSLRRRSQILSRRPDLEVLDLRGNVPTRVGRLEDGDYDAVVLACAGLRRLEMFDRRCQPLAPEEVLPAVAQGAIGIECRRDDQDLRALLGTLSCVSTIVCVRAERAMNATLGGNCSVPVAGFAEREGGEICLRGLVASEDGTRLVVEEQRGPLAAPDALGARVAEAMLGKGADQILAELAG